MKNLDEFQLKYLLSEPINLNTKHHWVKEIQVLKKDQGDYYLFLCISVLSTFLVLRNCFPSERYGPSTSHYRKGVWSSFICR